MNSQKSLCKNSKQWPQYLAVFCASICSFAVGLHYSWSSPSFPKLLADDYHLNITPDEASYVTVIFPMGDLLGAPFAAVLADIIGRKNGILLISIPVFIAWMFIAFAQNVYMLYIGRFIAGIGDGFLFIVQPMYVGEVTEPKIRGLLSCTLSLTMILGMIAMNSYAPFLSVQNTAFVSAIVPIVMVLLFVWMPESPYFHLMKNDEKQAKKSLEFLRRCDIEDEFEQIKKDVKRQMSERGTVKDLFYIESNRKALLIMLAIRSIQQFTGCSALSLLTQTIFTEAGGNISPLLSTLIYLLIQFIMTSIGSVLLEKFGRRPLLIFSSIGSGVMLLTAGTYFFIKEKTDINVDSINWLPLIILIGFIINFGVGLGTVPSSMLGEMFSASIKGKALCVMVIYYASTITITTKLFYYLTTTFGMFSAFYTFGVSTLLSVMFSYYFVPETKGKTLEEIQQEFKGKNKKSICTTNGINNNNN